MKPHIAAPPAFLLAALLACGAVGEPSCGPNDVCSQEDVETAEDASVDALRVELLQAGLKESKRKTVSESHGSSNHTAPGVSSGPTCYGYTGGTCSVEGCKSVRNSICSSDKYCICDLGCSGPDGTCYTEKNKVIAKSFTLANAKWPKYYLYFQAISTFGQMKVSNSWFGIGGAQFTLYQLPGEYEGQPKFFLGSSKWESSVAAISKTTGTALHPYAFYAKSLEKKAGAEDLAVTVCARTDGSIMIGRLRNSSITNKPVWAYIQHGTWLVYGYSSGDPGNGGYWIPKPALPANSVPACI